MGWSHVGTISASHLTGEEVSVVRFQWRSFSALCSPLADVEYEELVPFAAVPDENTMSVDEQEGIVQNCTGILDCTVMYLSLQKGGWDVRGAPC